MRPYLFGAAMSDTEAPCGHVRISSTDTRAARIPTRARASGSHPEGVAFHLHGRNAVMPTQPKKAIRARLVMCSWDLAIGGMSVYALALCQHALAIPAWRFAAWGWMEVHPR